MNVGYLDTPIGVLRIRSENNMIIEIHAMQEGEAVSEANEDLCILEAKKQLGEYFEGRRKSFEIDLDMSMGTEFQQRVWRVLRNIPYGKTLSYKEVAALADCPKGSRAVGNAVGANPFLIVVPCHRVIKGDGTIGGFSAGLDKKRGLMKIEGTT